MTAENSEVSITIAFDEAVQAIAYLSDLLDYLISKGYETQGIQTDVRMGRRKND